MGVNKRAVNLAVKGELGVFQLEFYVCYRLLNTGITFNHRVTILLGEALAVSQNPHEERIFTWFSFFSSLCKVVNVKPSDVTLETFVLLKEKLCDYYIRYWSERIKTFSKMDTYSLLKQRFRLENYISDVKKGAHRIILSKIRISNHRLAIETGRFSKTSRNERICLHCKTDNVSEIDDEQHLLLRCSRFSEIRIALFDHVRKSCSRIDTLYDENKFIYLLNSSGSTIKEVAKFLHSAFKARSA